MKEKEFRRLSQEITFKAGQWFLANKERLLKDRPTLVQVAQELSTALGIGIAPATVSRLQKITGVEWEGTTFNPSKLRPQIDALKGQVASLEKRVGELETMVLRLMDHPASSNGPVPAKPPAPALLPTPLNRRP